MPIYEYRCDKCGFQKEFLRRMSDAPLTDCPKCGKRSFKKLVTAAGFHLKGTGWYATDFKGSGAKPVAKQDKSESKSETKIETKTEAKTEAKTETKPDTKSETRQDKPAASSGKKSPKTAAAVPAGNNN
jgi:putative FmdB family regulatory protein